MPFLVSLLSSKWFWLALILGALALQTHRIGTAKAETAALAAKFAAYSTAVVAEHDRAVAAAKQAELAAIQRAKESDDAHAKKYADLDRVYAGYRLRVGAGGAATSLLAPKAAGDPAGDQTLYYSRDTLDKELTGALGRFRERLADSVRPYDEATLVAATCRDWALGLR